MSDNSCEDQGNGTVREGIGSGGQKNSNQRVRVYAIARAGKKPGLVKT